MKIVFLLQRMKLGFFFHFTITSFISFHICYRHSCSSISKNKVYKAYFKKGFTYYMRQHLVNVTFVFKQLAQNDIKEYKNLK